MAQIDFNRPISERNEVLNKTHAKCIAKRGRAIGVSQGGGGAKGGVMAGVGEPPSLSAQALLGTRCDRKDGRATRVSCVRGHQAVWLCMCVCLCV